MKVNTRSLWVVCCLLTSVGQAEISTHTDPQNAGRAVKPTAARGQACPPTAHTLGGHDNPNMEVQRGLESYLHYLGPAFAASLWALRENQHWMDGGSGDGIAIEEYLNGLTPVMDSSYLLQTTGQRPQSPNVPRAHRARVTGITIEMSRPIPQDPRLRVLIGKGVEEIPSATLTAAPFGKAALITDLYGAWSYTPRPDLVLKTYLDNLAEGGDIFFQANDTDNRVATANGGPTVSLLTWLRGIRGIDVETHSMNAKNGYTVRIRRNHLALHVPVLRERERANICPPTRFFDEIAQ